MAVIFWGCTRLKGRAGLLNPSPVQFLKVITRLTGEESTGKMAGLSSVGSIWDLLSVPICKTS